MSTLLHDLDFRFGFDDAGPGVWGVDELPTRKGP